MWISQLFEDENKHVTFCFGRMNPPTIGHKQVFDTMKSVGGDYLIFLSKTQNVKKDPLDYDTKVDFVKKILPEYADNIVDDPSLRTPWQVASYLYDLGYRHATFVGGDDRKQMYQQLKEFNGVEGKPHGFYDFETFDFQSAGAREEGAQGLAGISATVARKAAAEGDLDAFAEATGAGKHAEELYNAVRKGMGVSEKEAEPVTEGFIQDISTRNLKYFLKQILKNLDGPYEQRMVDVIKKELANRGEAMAEQKNKPNPVAKNMEKFNRPQTHKDRKKDRDRGYEKHKGKDMQFSDIQRESYYDDADPEIAKLGRILMDKAVTQKSEDMSNIMSTVGSELTKFGSNQGARDLQQLEKRVGMPADMIRKMMEYASKFEDETKYKVKDPEPGEEDEDDDFKEGMMKPGEAASRHGGNVLSTLERIIDKKQEMPVSFQDGKGKVDMFTASAIMQVYDAVNDDNKSKMKDALSTKAGFMKMAKFAMGKIGEGLDEDNFEKNFKKRVGYTVRGGAASDMMKKQAAQAQKMNKELDPGAAEKGLGIGVLDTAKARKKRQRKM